MSYDNLHNITSKKQHISQTDVAFEGELLAGYELAYNYRTDKPHQLASINDNNYRTADSTAVESSIKNLQDAYTYDSNGNLIFVNTADSVQTNLKERQLSWDEENRLRSICDNGYISSYFYDAGGARTVKLHGSGEGIHVNSAFSGGYTNNVDYTLYVDAYMVLEKGGQYTKHIYIGDQRIVSKLGDVGSFGVDPRREQYAGEDVAGVEVPDYKTKYEALQNVIKDNYQLFEVDYYGVDNDNYVDGEGFCCEPKAQAKNTRSLPTENVDYEKLQYYYHSDHLGSASYITNLDGEVVQHIEYVPFGEVFLEERNNTWNTPFLFNGKELDEETGLYYYGARYYNPRTSLWLSVDPIATYNPVMETEHYIDGQHNGGVFNAKNLNVYGYCYQNPVILVDPNGRQTFFIHGTNSAPNRWTENSVNTLNRLTNNTTTDVAFSWEDLDNLTNDVGDRTSAGMNLALHVLANRNKDEEITFIGHSHGGNVAIIAAKIIYAITGEKSNLITIATPVYEGTGEIQDPASDGLGSFGREAINDHIHIFNKIDGIQGGLAGEKEYNGNRTRNFEIDVSSEYNSIEWIDSHSFDTEHPELIRNQMGDTKLEPIK